MRLVYGLFGMALTAGCIRSTATTHIVNGAELGPDNPGHVNTVGLTSAREGSSSDTSPFCTASIVAPGWVLTAAHCIKSKPGFVYFHNTTRSEGVLYRQVTRTVIHPDYQGSDSFDLALVEFASAPSDENRLPPGFSSIPIFPESGRSHLEKQGVVMLVGYGRESQRQPAVPGKKLAAEVQIHKVWLDSFLGTGLITYRDEQGRGACHGDSGGPAYVKNGRGEWNLVGVTHGIRGRFFGITRLPTCDEGMGIYTWTSPFTTWILETVKGGAPKGWNWAESSLPFSNAGEVCRAPQRTSVMHRALLTLANALEDLTDVPMSDCDHFARAVETVTRYETFDVQSVAPLLPLVANMINLERLSLAHADSSSRFVLPAGLFAPLGKLSMLTLRRVTLATLGQLQNLPVRALELVKVGNLDVQYLAPLPLLTRLRLEMEDGNPRLNVLGQLPNLVTLEALDVVLNAQALSDLAELNAFPRLDMASFSGSTKMDYGALLALVEKYAKLPARKRFVFPKARSDEDKIKEEAFKTRLKELGGRVSISFY
jgi:hypothetical protein